MCEGWDFQDHAVQAGLHLAVDMKSKRFWWRTLWLTPPNLIQDFFWFIPQNRGGTGINAWSMHAKGAIICQSGADLNLLMGSVCFELSLDPEKKKAQVAFNKAMSDISQGMMAEPSGQERYLSVSKGHTSQFCKSHQSLCQNTSNLIGLRKWLFGASSLAKRYWLEDNVYKRVGVVSNHQSSWRGLSWPSSAGRECL